jgi:hypothetical protein
MSVAYLARVFVGRSPPPDKIVEDMARVLMIDQPSTLTLGTDDSPVADPVLPQKQCLLVRQGWRIVYK